MKTQEYSSEQLPPEFQPERLRIAWDYSDGNQKIQIWYGYGRCLSLTPEQASYLVVALTHQIGNAFANSDGLIPFHTGRSSHQ